MTHLCSTCRNMALRHACTDRIWHNQQGSLAGFVTNGDVVTACPEHKIQEGVFIGIQPPNEKPVDVWA